MRVVWVTGKYYVRQVLETLAKLEPLDAARRMTRGDRIILWPANSADVTAGLS